jgi:peptidase T-like protein
MIASGLASPVERARLAETFVALCEIESPSGREAEAAGFVRSMLEGLGLVVEEDASAGETGAACGNLLARTAGPQDGRTVMLCAHLDTVPLADRVEVELAEGVYRNRRDAILGADNKAAVAVLLEVARRFAVEPPPVGVELLFTTCEEVGLRGASAFDLGRLHAEFGYVFDHASAIGELIVAAPTYYRVIGEFLGRAAHAGLRPEAGRNAIVAAAMAVDQMKLGRIDAETTANVGVIEGGTAANVVAERCRLEAEVRSLDDARECGHEGDGRCAHLGCKRHRDGRRHHGRGAVPRVPDLPGRAGCQGRRSCTRGLRRAADPHGVRRRQRRAHLPGEGAVMPQHGERDRGEPHARRVRERRRARDDARYRAAAAGARGRALMLSLRRGRVASIQEAGARVVRLTVELEGGGEVRPALAYPGLTGELEEGDDVIVNVAARDLGLGSGGFDVLHANLSRGLAAGTGDAHVMKLNYTSIQHAVAPVEDGLEELPRRPGLPVAVLALHGQLPAVAFALATVREGIRAGYVQSAGGALPGPLSDTVADLGERGMLAGHVTAGPAHGAALEAITVEGAIDAGARLLEWDCAIVGPGPGIVGSASALGHGGLAALANAHAALSLGCPVALVPRLSSGDPRDRHRGLSHHTETVLKLLLRPVRVAVPAGASLPSSAGLELALAHGAEHEPVRVNVSDLVEPYLSSGLPTQTMGRSFDEDRDFFLAGLAGGVLLADLLPERRAG